MLTKAESTPEWSKPRDLVKAKNSDIKSYVIAAPKYVVEVLSETYKREYALQKANQTVIANIKKADGQGSF